MGEGSLRSWTCSPPTSPNRLYIPALGGRIQFGVKWWHPLALRFPLGSPTVRDLAAARPAGLAGCGNVRPRGQQRG